MNTEPVIQPPIPAAMYGWICPICEQKPRHIIKPAMASVSDPLATKSYLGIKCGCTGSYQTLDQTALRDQAILTHQIEITFDEYRNSITQRVELLGEPPEGKTLKEWDKMVKRYANE